MAERRGPETLNLNAGAAPPGRRSRGALLGSVSNRLELTGAPRVLRLAGCGGGRARRPSGTIILEREVPPREGGAVAAPGSSFLPRGGPATVSGRRSAGRRYPAACLSLAHSAAGRDSAAIPLRLPGGT